MVYQLVLWNQTIPCPELLCQCQLEANWVGCSHALLAWADLVLLPDLYYSMPIYFSKVYPPTHVNCIIKPRTFFFPVSVNIWYIHFHLNLLFVVVASVFVCEFDLLENLSSKQR